MKRTRLITFILALVMVLGLLPAVAGAAELKQPEKFEATALPVRVNPLYQDILSPDDLDLSSRPVRHIGDAEKAAAKYVTRQEAAKQMRNYMTSRTESFVLYVQDSSTDYETLLNDMFAVAISHTGKPKEGDYLMWQYAGIGGSVERTSGDGGYQYCFSIEMAYYTTAAQEKEMDTAVSNLLKSLNVSGKSDYQKVGAVYDYICDNVTYDYDNLEDDSYTLKFTAYAALKNKTAVCQGYALLFYRLMLELGIDARVIAGDGGGPHGWNIVKLGNVYYNADTTWDAGVDEYQFFLKNTENFVNHARYLDYMTTQFHTDYPMSATDYVDGVAGEPEYFFVVGQCGENAFFGINRDKELVIAGEGATYDFIQTENIEDGGTPWQFWADGFTDVIVDEGITVLGENAFFEMDNFTNVTLPSTLKTIGWYAFNNCDGLTHIEFPDGLMNILSYSFYDCDNLTQVKLPAALRTVSASTFAGCNALATVTLPDSLTEIGANAFSGCESLTEIIIPDQVTIIENGAFANCDGLTTVVIPASVTSLSGFAHCSNLQTVQLNNSGVINIDAFSQCYKLTNVIIPDTITEISNGAFYECLALTEIIIPESVTHIRNNAFSRCHGLKSAYIYSKGPIGFRAFDECDALSKVVLSEGITVIDSYAFGKCVSLTELVIPSTVTEIQNYAFDKCEKLKTITFTGDAPAMRGYSLTDIIGTAYYPGDNETWRTEEIVELMNHFRNITWISTHTHTYTASVVAPTCTEQGYTLHACACGDSYKDTYVIALGHDYAEPEYISREEGHSYECSRCGDVKTESCTFDEGNVLVEATPDQFGIIEHTCTLCGGSYKTEFVYRLYGDSRITTAIEVANKMKEVLSKESFDFILIANGNNFADALTGSYLASVKEAPILLYRAKGMELNELYIQENLSEDGIVYILGGTAAVPAEVDENLKNAGYNVERLYGDSRFETNLKILEAAGVTDEEILLCTGSDYADSLSASATGLPILMLNTVKNELTENQIAFLEKYADNDFTIIGGTAAVSDELKAKVESIVGEVDRIYGNGREATSVKVAERYFGKPGCVLIAYSRNFPDGLCGGPLAHAMKAPLLLVNANKEADAADYVAVNNIRKGIILGGTAAVSEDVVRVVFDIS